VTGSVTGRVVALSGGVGGAKLALGLARVLDPLQLAIIVNTADDFRHLGLEISPDLDTLLYTLSGLSDPARGWGRRDETWTFMGALEQLGGENWFRLGDADLAMHVERTRRLAAGETLSMFIDDVRRRLGIESPILPMTDDPVSTRVRTDDGWLAFQDYFVRRHCMPSVQAIEFAGAASARALPEAMSALLHEDLQAVVICPSNPFVSIDPIVAVPGIREALTGCRAPIVAVCPIIGGQALRGPTCKIMRELGIEPHAREIALHYADFIDVFVVDEIDAGMDPPPGVTLIVTHTLMRTLEDRESLARVVLSAASQVAKERNRCDEPVYPEGGL
jgi:LPPG:FO 2-phospho-L-lactate transferase